MKMPSVEYGFQRAIYEIVTGFILSLILNIFASNGLLSPSWIHYFQLLNLLLTIALISAMPYWGTGYLIGWLFGLIIMAKVGLVGFQDFLVYFIIPVIIMVRRIIKSTKKY